MNQDDARMLSPLALAYVGDSVHDLFVRAREAGSGRSVANLHRDAVRKVCCVAQSEALSRIESTLNEEESRIVRRGRNCHAHHAAPRGAPPAAYARATGLEALLGYLYLSGQDERLTAILNALDAQS
jgi:ribonuclease-3 family protein